MKSVSEIPYYYLELQRRATNLFRYISCHERNFETYSIVLESLLVDACSFFDSLCQTFIREKSRAGHNFATQAEVDKFHEKLEGDADFNFANYRDLLEPDLALSGKQVNLNPYEGNYFSNPMQFVPDNVSGYLLKPFDEWRDERALPWWKAFTDLKHDRISNFREATFKNVLNALAGVFIQLTLRHEQEFKEGRMALELYDLFFPKYWNFKGRVTLCNFTWE